MKRAAFARINLTHLAQNFAVIRKFAHQSKIMAVVKADAYGHGVLQVCNGLTDADAFAVTYINEALELRANGINKPILALQGFNSGEDLKYAIDHDLQVVIHHAEQLNILRTLKQRKTLNVFLKMDTGMHRLGFEYDVFQETLAELKSLLTPDSKIHIMTHLACADESDNQMTPQQLVMFDQFVDGQSYQQSIANSAGVIAWPNSHRTWVRPGLALYGINPVQASTESPSITLHPVMSVHAPLISIKTCKKGEKIGYGGDFCCPNDMQVGIIAIGYADGYPRHLKTMPCVGIGGRKAPLVGRVSMDMVAVDLTGIDAGVGQLAELWGEGISVEDVAGHAETISYELLCAAGNSVVKKYI